MVSTLDKKETKEQENTTMKIKKMKKCIALLEGKVLVEDCLQAALDNNMMLDDLKAKLISENNGKKVTFIYK